MQGARFLAAVAALSSLTGCVIQVPAEQPAPVAQQPQQSEWIAVSTDSYGAVIWEVKSGSFRFAKSADGVMLGMVSGRAVIPSHSKIELQLWHVVLTDCAKGMGKLYMSDMSDSPIGEADFIFKGGNQASNIAETICEAAEISAEAMRQRSSPSSAAQEPAI